MIKDKSTEFKDKDNTNADTSILVLVLMISKINQMTKNLITF